LSEIKILNIFKWLKSNNLSDNEMLKTFNCGVGFCVIAKFENVKIIQKFFPKNYKPYIIGKITSKTNRVELLNKIKW